MKQILEMGDFAKVCKGKASTHDNVKELHYGHAICRGHKPVEKNRSRPL